MAAKLTLKDIASAAGVSEMTASRALRDASDVSKATKERVEKAAAELGYVRNKIAGALASNKVDLVGVVIPSVKSYVFSEVLDGISNALSETRLRPVFGLTDYNPKTEAEVIEEMLSWRPSGLIVAGMEHTERARKMMENVNIPVIEIMDTDGEPVDTCVGISHFGAGYKMAQTILDRGYREIGFIGTKMESDFRAQKRFAGFKKCLKENNIPLAAEGLYVEGSSFAKGKELTAALLAENPSLKCIYYSTDIASIGGLMHCLAQGISVPDDLALAGFNRLGMLDGLPLELATMDSLRYEIGRTAAEIIHARNQDPSSHTEKIIRLEPKIILGQSL